jgi:hypothetical protein
VFPVVATFTENKRRLVVVELAEMVEHKRDVTASATPASSAGRADPSPPDPLERVAAKDAAAVAALFASGPRLRRVLEAASLHDGDVRAAGCTADTGRSSHAYIFGGRPGGASNSRTAPSGQ